MTALMRQRDAVRSRLLDTPSGDWRDGAACADHDPEMFHPNRGWSGRTPAEGDRRRVTAAKAVCADCPSRVACLTWAYEIGDDWAVLGGTTPEERRAVRLVVRPKERATA